MKIDLMRRLDAWLGRPLCLFATAVEKLRTLAQPSPDRPGRHLLIIKLSEQGAIVMLGEMLRRLHRTYPREKIWFLAFEDNRQILEVTGLVPPENIITISTANLPTFAASTMQALRAVWRIGIDDVLDLEFFSRVSALLAWLSGARRRTGVHAYFGEGPWRGDLMTHRVKFNPHMHISQTFVALAEAAMLTTNTLQCLEVSPPPPEPIRERFAPTPEEQQNVSALLRERGVSEQDRIVLLNANISDRELIPLRKWDEKNYIELARRLLTHSPRIKILLTGNSREATAVDELERAIGSERCRSVAGRTTMRELLTLYGCADVMVTNDSGPAQFAALTDLTVIVLFGPETPQLWRPLGRQVHVLYRGLACSPCFSIYNGRNSSCNRNACMDISPDEVFAVASKILPA